MTMSKKAERIAQRYAQRYVTDEQLERYHELGVLTDEEYAHIYASKHTDEQ